MCLTNRRSLIIVTVLLVLSLCSGIACALSDLETKRIDYLIACVETLNGAKFVRNGKEYDGKQAASHLRMKLKNTADKVHSAEDFIEICASKSYLSGKPYLIVFHDGKTMPSEEFFRMKLKGYTPTAK
jgi:hypothetical protein